MACATVAWRTWGTRVLHMCQHVGAVSDVFYHRFHGRGAVPAYVLGAVAHVQPIPIRPADPPGLRISGAGLGTTQVVVLNQEGIGQRMKWQVAGLTAHSSNAAITFRCDVEVLQVGKETAARGHGVVAVVVRRLT